MRFTGAARCSVAAFAACVALLLAAPIASAADPNDAQSNAAAGGAAKPLGSGEGNGGGTAASGSSSSAAASDQGSGSGGLSAKVVAGLPFTGLDLIALAVVAIALTAMGLVLRRINTAPDEV